MATPPIPSGATPAPTNSFQWQGSDSPYSAPSPVAPKVATPQGSIPPVQAGNAMMKADQSQLPSFLSSAQPTQPTQPAPHPPQTDNGILTSDKMQQFAQLWESEQTQGVSPDVFFNQVRSAANPNDAMRNKLNEAYDGISGTPYQRSLKIINYLAYGDLNGKQQGQQGQMQGIADHLTFGQAASQTMGMYGNAIKGVGAGLWDAASSIPKFYGGVGNVMVQSALHGQNSPETQSAQQGVWDTAQHVVNNLPTYAATALGNPEMGPGMQAAIAGGASAISHGTNMIGGEEPVNAGQIGSDLKDIGTNALLAGGTAKALGYFTPAKPDQVTEMVTPKETPGEALSAGRLQNMSKATPPPEAGRIATSVQDAFGGRVPKDPLETATSIVKDKIPELSDKLRATVEENNAPINRSGVIGRIQTAMDEDLQRYGNESAAKNAYDGIMNVFKKQLTENSDGTLSGLWDSRIATDGELEGQFGTKIFATPTDALDTARRGAVRTLRQTINSIIDENLTRAMNDNAGATEGSAMTSGTFKQGMSTLHDLYTAVGNIADKLPSKFEKTAGEKVMSVVKKAAPAALGTAATLAGGAGLVELSKKAKETLTPSE